MTNTEPNFAVGEIWKDLAYGNDGKPEYDQDAHRLDIVGWIQGARRDVMAFNFTAKGILQIAVEGELWRLNGSSGGAPGVIGLLPRNAVTFIDNHDTCSTQNHWPFPLDKIMQGCVNILTHPGIPSIFYDHFFDLGLKEEILKLIEVRTRNQIRPNSVLRTLASDTDHYMAAIDRKIIAKVGPNDDKGNLVPATFQIAASGRDYTVWERKSLR